MKRIPRNIFFIIIAFVFLLGLAPRLFILEKVKQTIIEEISTSLNSSVSIKKMHWVWLPLPHLTLIDTSISNEYSRFSLPKVRIYPHWRILLGEFRRPRRIRLENPEIYIHRIDFGAEKTAGLDMPEVSISVKNGTIWVNQPAEYKDVLQADSLQFSNIRGTVRLVSQRAEVELQSSSPFSKNISLRGNIDTGKGNYQLFFDCQDIKLLRAVKTLLHGHLVPMESTARLAGSITGKGWNHIEGDLHGTLPSFTVKHDDREILITSGYVDMAFFKSGPVLRLAIKDLEIKDPQLNLSGQAERKISLPGSGHEETTPEPIWTLDITGSDLDLSAIRRKILTLWGDNEIAGIVCNIVLDGKALSAGYRFSGRSADFKNLHAMVIEADVLSASIHVPGAELDLANASGPILIKDSILTGHGLSAQLGDSHGRNGKLLLDLAEKGTAFNLDIDIDADLAALPPILEDLVGHEVFLRELEKFREITGRASGNLRLGDSLHNMAVRVAVDTMQGTGRYDPIPQSFFIDSGTLQVDPQKVSWQKVRGRIGQQEITATSGNVSWHTGEPALLQIEEMNGQLDGASLYALLLQTGTMPREISNILSSLDGSIALSHGVLRGPAFTPEAWEYQFSAKTKAISFASPLLPEPAATGTVSATLNQAEINLLEAEVFFLDQTINLEGLLQHRLLEDWHGMIELNGPVRAKLASWISSRGWYPEKLRPKIPCTVEDLQIRWQGETFAVTGMILSGLDGGRLPMARVDFEDTPERLRINELTFFAPGEEGSLALDFWRLSPYSIAISWKGDVSAETIDALFRHSSFTAGNFSGTFKIDYFADKPGASLFQGLLKAENLLFKNNDSEMPIVIKNINIAGDGRQLRLPVLDLSVGTETIHGQGQLAAEDDGLQLDIAFVSSYLTKEAVDSLNLAFRKTLHDFLDPIAPQDQNGSLRVPMEWNITGRIGFDFDSFAFSRPAATPYHESQTVTYTLYDVQGDLQMAPDTISRTEIFTSNLCGLEFRGKWYSDENLGQLLEIYTDPGESISLEHVLPCLGVQQDLIEGNFTLQANLRKESDTWYSGNIHINSDKGRILRLKTLSKIFKVVNITDLFEDRVENSGAKGFPFSQMVIDSHIETNNLIFDRALIRGEGLNLYGRGEVHLDDWDADLTILIAPFKSFDAMVSKVPIIGQPVMGEYGSRVSIPVAVKGPLTDPSITPLHPDAVGDTVLNLLKDTIMLPINILTPDKDTEKDNTE